MALKFVNGIADVTGRDCRFRNGVPVDPDRWTFFKDKIERLRPDQALMISYDFVGKLFNPVVDAWTGMIIQSSIDRLRIFCAENNLIFSDNGHQAQIKKPEFYELIGEY